MRKNRISWLSLGYGILLLVFVLVNRAVAYREVSSAVGECLRTFIFSAALLLSSVRECSNRNYLWAVSGIVLAVALPLMTYLDMDIVLIIPLAFLFLLSIRTVQISLPGNVSAVEAVHTKYGALQPARQKKYTISQEKAAFDRLLGAINQCSYLKNIRQSPINEELQPDAFTLEFVENHTAEGRRIIFTYTVYSDGQIVINRKRVRCSPLSIADGRSIYDSVGRIVDDMAADSGEPESV